MKRPPRPPVRANSGNISLLAAAKAVSRAFKGKPLKRSGYDRRIVVLECLDYCNAGGEPVDGAHFVLDKRDLDELIAALSAKAARK